jgi:hypothetical protein
MAWEALGGAGVGGPTTGDFFIYFVMGSWTLVRVVVVVGFLLTSEKINK